MAAPATAPGAGIRFDWDPPLDQFHFELNRFADGIADFSGVFGELGELFKAEMAAQFATEGDASGDEWAPLSTAYALWKAKHYPGRMIGWRTGALMASLTGGPGYTEIIGPTTAEFGEADDAKAGAYARYFADGTDKMPARPVLRMTAAWGEAWQRMTAGWVREQAHHSGLIGEMSSLGNTPLSGLSYQEPLPAD